MHLIWITRIFIYRSSDGVQPAGTSSSSVQGVFRKPGNKKRTNEFRFLIDRGMIGTIREFREGLEDNLPPSSWPVMQPVPPPSKKTTGVLGGIALDHSPSHAFPY